jgi:predicted acylesterase/phospholipase RssA
MMSAKDCRQALVLSGGGAYGAFEVGVMKALFKGECPATNYNPLDPDIFMGTSVGCLNAAFIVSRAGQPLVSTVEELENLWLDEMAENAQGCGNGVYRFRGNPIDFLDLRCLLNNPLVPRKSLSYGCWS